MALDLKYAPKFGPAITLAGGGGNDQQPPTDTPIRTGDNRAPDARDTQRTPAGPSLAPVHKLTLTLRRYAHTRITQERKAFALGLDKHFESLESSYAIWRLR
jgi:hypothetical protein